MKTALILSAAVLLISGFQSLAAAVPPDVIAGEPQAVEGDGWAIPDLPAWACVLMPSWCPPDESNPPPDNRPDPGSGEADPAKPEDKPSDGGLKDWSEDKTKGAKPADAPAGAKGTAGEPEKGKDQTNAMGISTSISYMTFGNTFQRNMDFQFKGTQFNKEGWNST